MRTRSDRIRHAISFEIIGLIISTPAAAFIFGMPLHDMGLVSLVSASIATLWNYAYNLLFDHAMIKIAGSVSKTMAVRVIHAVIFELGILIVLMPFIAWYLNVSLLQAFTMDLSFAVFYMVYAFVFNWGYDQVFPIPQT